MLLFYLVNTHKITKLKAEKVMKINENVIE